MIKQAIKNKSVLAIAIVLMFVLVFAGIGITAMSRSTKSANADGTFIFYDYDGTQLADVSNSIDPPSSPSRTGYTFDGWYCNTNKVVYSAEELVNLDTEEVTVNGGANFYATYKKTNATGDYIEFTSSVVSATGDFGDNGNVGRPYASVDNMDYVYVRYDITYNAGVNSLLVLLDYDTTAFSLSYSGTETLDDVITFESTALGEPTINNDDAHSIVWDKSGEAFSSLKNNFFIVRYTINKEEIVSERDYYFGVKIYPYAENGSSVAYRYATGESTGEQVDVPVTQIVKKFTPVIRQAATITIGGNLDDDDVINPLERFYSGTYANTAFSTLMVEQLPAIDDEDFDFIVRYTYDGDATPAITWMSFVDGNNYIADRTYQYSAISAPKEPGRYMVMITAPETLKYYAAGPAFCEISINKINRNISIEDKSHTYGGTPSTPLYEGSTSGITFSAFATTQADEPQTVTLSSATDVAVYDIRYTLAFDAAHYNVSINGISASAGTAVDSGFDYRVFPKEVAFTIDNKSHTYGDTPASLTVSGGESGISCTAYIAKNSEAVALSSTTTAGTYDIMYTLTASTALTNYTFKMNGNIVVTSTGDTGSNYTVNKKTIWLKAMPQTHTFTGENVEISTGSNRYFFYSNEGCTQIYDTANLLDFDATKISLFYVDEYGNPTGYSAMGDYENAIRAIYAPVSEKIDPNHEIREKRGSLSIRGTTADYFYQFFETTDRTYNSAGQVVIATKNGVTLPEWITSIGFKTSGNDEFQTDSTLSDGASYSEVNAATYYFDVKLTFSDASYFNGQDSYVIISDIDEDEAKHLRATISPAAVTLKPVDHGHVYGSTPETLTYTVTSGTVYQNDNLNVQYVVKDTNEDNIVLSSSTYAGEYTIIITNASNSNYSILIADENATYTVSKASNTVTLTANAVYYYNRPLEFIPTATNGTPEITYYSDANGQNVIDTPVNYGAYYAKATVAASQNYSAGESDIVRFEIWQVALEGVTLTYSQGNVTWSAVTNDAGNPEYDVPALELKSGTTVTYTIYKLVGDEPVLVDTIAPGETLSFDAEDSAFYYLVATASDNNYTTSTTTIGYAYAVTFDKGDVTSWKNYPSTFYVFEGQSFTVPAAPASDDGKTFSVWKINTTSYNPGLVISDVSDNYAFVATWDAIVYTMTVVYIKNDENHTQTTKTFNATDGEEVAVSTYNLKLQTGLTGNNDDMATSYDLNGIRYTFNNLWSYKITGEDTYIEESIHQVPVTVHNNYTFVAVYTGAPIEYTLTYKLSTDGGNYVTYSTVENIAFDTTITYESLESKVWFATQTWYTDEERTEAAPAKMPAGDLIVYGAYKFDIGTGDVNGNGAVTADDITVYRRWIVGGYAITPVATGTEWTVATTAYNSNAVYFLQRVADINVDESKDIRDVSITRMSLVGGYSWDIVTGESVTGSEIVRSQKISTYEDLNSWFNVSNKERASLIAYIDSPSANFTVSTNHDIFIDLCGNTLKLDSLTLTTSGTGATITIKNGTIITTAGITITAPNGNVTISNVTAYDNGNEINLQAASSSLHFFGTVAFRKGTVQESTVADVKVATGTHIVIEKAAQVVVEKIVAAIIENDVFVQSTTAEITIKNDSAVTEAIEIVGNYVEEDSTVESKVITKVSTKDELIAANGKVVYLDADISTGNTYVAYSQDTTLNLNGYSITFGKWGFEVNSGATLIVNGDEENSSVSAVQACFDVLGASKLYINGGTYTTTDNCAIFCHEGSYLEISDATVEALESCVLVYSDSEALIKDGTYTSYDNFVVGTNGTSGWGGSAITIEGGVYNGNITTGGYVACGVYVANSDEVEISGGTFNVTNGVGVLARSGKTTIGADVVFNVTGSGDLGKIGDSRVVVPTGKELVVDLIAKYPGGDPSIVNNSTNEVYAVVGNNEIVELTFVSDLTDMIDAYYAQTPYIALAGNIYYNGMFTFTENTTLYLNGYLIGSANSNALGILGAGKKLTIYGPGNVTAQEACVMAFDGAVIEINGGNYSSSDNFVVGTNGTAGRGNNTITINAGTFNAAIQTEGYIACGIYVANNDTVVVNGGTFNITNGIGILARSGNTTISDKVVFNIEGGSALSGGVGDKDLDITSGSAIVKDLSNPAYPGGTPIVTNNSSYAVVTLE